MKTKVRDTSLKAYDEIKDSLGRTQMEVYQFFKMHGPHTNSECANFLGWSINRITGRNNELRELGLLEASGKRKCNCTGRMAYIWKACDKIKVNEHDWIQREMF